MQQHHIIAVFIGFQQAQKFVVLPGQAARQHALAWLAGCAVLAFATAPLAATVDGSSTTLLLARPVLRDGTSPTTLPIIEQIGLYATGIDSSWANDVRLRLVAWRTPRAVYWISNTLLLSLTEKQMLAIARSVRAL